MKIILMRGIPGSGKSTIAQTYIASDPDGVIVSPTHYFMKGGQYKFDFSKLKDAHGECFRRFLNILQEFSVSDVLGRKVSVMVVDKTNIRCIELAPYIAAAEAYGHEHVIANVRCPEDVAYLRQTHDVPAKVHANMYRRLLKEELPSFWNRYDIFNE